MGPTNNIGYLLQHLAFTMSRQNDQLLQDALGIGFSQFKILMVLQRNPYIQQKDIAEALGQTEASVSRQIKLMHDSGLLRTTVTPENRRRHLTVPTDKGVKLTEKAMQALNSYHAPMFKRLTDTEQAELVQILSKMHEHVCQPGKIGACHKPFNV